MLWNDKEIMKCCHFSYKVFFIISVSFYLKQCLTKRWFRWVNTLNSAMGLLLPGLVFKFSPDSKVLLSDEHFRAQFDLSAQVLLSLNFKDKATEPGLAQDHLKGGSK